MTTQVKNEEELELVVAEGLRDVSLDQLIQMHQIMYSDLSIVKLNEVSVAIQSSTGD